MISISFRSRLLLFVFFLQHAVICQTISDRKVFKQYRQFSWNSENGLPRDSVTSIQQTRDGYLWVATPEGLARFDGVNFTFYDAKALKQDWSAIASLVLDHSGALWLAIRSHGLTRLKDGVFTSFNPTVPAGSYITEQIFEDRTGNLWLATSGSGLLRFRDGQTSILSTRDGLPSNAITSIAQDANGNLWVGTEAGVARLSGGKVRVFTKRDGLEDEYITAVGVDRTGILWTGSVTGRISSLRDSRFVPYRQQDHTPQSRITQLYCDKDNRIWVGTNKGVMLIDRGRILTYSARDGLPADDVRAIYQDEEGDIWIGTYSGGIVELRDVAIETYRIPGKREYGFTSLITGANGSLWAGGDDGFYALEGDSLQKLAWGRRLFGSTITKDISGAYWVTDGAGLDCVQNNRRTKVIAAVLPDDRINTVYSDRRGRLWVGTRANGVCLFQDGKCTSFTTRDGLGHNDIVSFYEDRLGAIWVATLNGASRIQDGRISTWTTKDGLPSNVIAGFYQTRAGSLWIATQGGGLSRFKNGHFSNVTTENGLFDNLAFQILEDDQGLLWMSCNRGIYRANLRELEECADGVRKTISSYSYGSEDGMPTNDCNGGTPGGWRSPDGRVWFGTTKGVVALDPRRLTSGLPPKVLIDQVGVEGKLILTSHEVHLAQNQHSLEVKYTVLKCDRPRQARFKVKLEGLDEDWKDPGVRRSMSYSYLPPGSYTFHVIADNGEGIWNTTGDYLNISVATPFYKSWWFLTACALLAVLLTTLAWRMRMAGLIRARESQQQFLQRLISSQELERKRLAGELHDGLAQRLTMVRNFALMLGEGTLQGTDKRSLSVITSETAEALREVREISYALRPYQLDYLGLREAVRALVAKVQDGSGMKFSCHLDDVNDLVPKESEIHLYRIVQECLNNIVKHARATSVEVNLRRDGSCLRLEICDDGVGFILGAAGGSSTRSGLGLTSISERVQLLGGTMSLHSTPGKGTRIDIECIRTI